MVYNQEKHPLHYDDAYACSHDHRPIAFLKKLKMISQLRIIFLLLNLISLTCRRPPRARWPDRTY
jgi:hypothetical protein